MLACLFAVPVAIRIGIVAIRIVIIRRARIHGIEDDAQSRHRTAESKSRVRVKASFGVCPLRTTSKTPSVSAERITASVAAMTGGESITMNLYRRRNSVIASRIRWEESKSAGLGGTGPVVNALKLLIAGCGVITSSRLETPAR